MSETTGRFVEWVPSVYYAGCILECAMDHAWRQMWEYARWNPTFAGARITPLRGSPRTEGELVLVSKTLSAPAQEAFPEFYCETVRIVQGRHIAWYVHAKEGQSYRGQKDPFRNFVEFGLSEESHGVRFDIRYYAQNRLSGGTLCAERELMQPLLSEIAMAFLDHCRATRP